MSQEHELIWYILNQWLFISVIGHKHSIYIWKVDGNYKMTSEMNFLTQKPLEKWYYNRFCP